MTFSTSRERHHCPRPPRAVTGFPELPAIVTPRGRPEGLDIHTQHLASAVGVDANRHDDGDRDDAAGLADLHVGGVDPQIRPIALDRPVEEGFDALVDLLAQSARSLVALLIPATPLEGTRPRSGFLGSQNDKRTSCQSWSRR